MKFLLIVLLSILIVSCGVLPTVPHINSSSVNYFKVDTIKIILWGIENLIVFWVGMCLICSVIICLLTQYVGNKIPIPISKMIISCFLCITVLYFGMKWIMGADNIPNLVFCILVFITSNSGWAWLINDLRLQNHFSAFLTDKPPVNIDNPSSNHNYLNN